MASRRPTMRSFVGRVTAPTVTTVSASTSSPVSATTSPNTSPMIRTSGTVATTRARDFVQATPPESEEYEESVEEERLPPVSVTQRRTVTGDPLARVEISGVPILTEEQIDMLRNLTLLNGDPIVDDSFVYPLVSMIAAEGCGFQTIYEHLTSRKWTSRKDIILEAPVPTLKRAHVKSIIDAEIFRNRTTAVDESTPCPRCKARKVRSATARTRSADEPMTEFYICTACGFKWRVG
jgi:DNA-directed RNA polymerase subunit M/transcription elongation factor TFIIS